MYQEEYSMLVLTRRNGEWIRITTASGEVIRLQMVDARSNKARLGFECHTDTIIVREELLPNESAGLDVLA